MSPRAPCFPQRLRASERLGEKPWHWNSADGELMEYDSVAVVESKARAGVRFEIARMSFGRRLELMRRVRELARRVEFLEAGESPGERMDAGLLRAEID